MAVVASSVRADPGLAGICAIAIIAKAPRPGHVKTRLQGLVTPDEAAALGAAFLHDTVENLVEAARHAPIAPFIAYAPAGEEGRFDMLRQSGAGLILADGIGGDGPGVEGFGRVLLDAMRALLARGYGAVCVLGADSPTLPTGELVRAARCLLDGSADAVLGEADDGGYWLLGLREANPAAFAHIAWSTDAAGAMTRGQLDRAGLRTCALATWYDIDDPPGLRRVLADIGGGGLGYAAPRTAAVLRRLEIAGRLELDAVPRERLSRQA